MQRAAFLFALLGSASAIVCPRDRSTLAIKAEGEECGGACDASGICGEGLMCVVPQASPLSFAIFVGAPAKVGTCQGHTGTRPAGDLPVKTLPVKHEHTRTVADLKRADELARQQPHTVADQKHEDELARQHRTVADQKHEDELARQQAGESKRKLQVMGGSSEASVEDEEVIAAAKYATTYIQSRSNGFTVPALSRIVSARKQVVAGMAYTLGLRMDDGHIHRIQVVDTPWLTPRYKVTLFEPNALD
jgi:hypothetical protein